MDERLRLHNAVLGLSHRSPPWPSPLADAGYEIARIEQRVTTSDGDVVVDLLFAARERSALLAVECKDGTVQDQQARRYEAMQPIDVVRTASITLPDPPGARLDVAYAVWGASAAPTVQRLAAAAPSAGTLAIDTHIRWLGPAAGDPHLRSVFSQPLTADLRALPRLMLADDNSPPSALAAAVANQIQAAIEAGRESITVGTLVEQACWGWPRYGRAFQGRLVREVAEMLRQAQSMDLAELIEVEKRTGQSSDIVVRLRIPPGAATQAGELRGSRAVRARLERFVAQVTGRSVPPTPGQLDLFSGLDELEGEDEE